MSERPILFSGPMVKAILEGRKTMTRRVVKPQPIDVVKNKGLENSWCAVRLNGAFPAVCPYGQVGDRLWVRETWYVENNDDYYPYYKASEEHPEIFPKWRPSIFMPRWASRITLEITGVRVEKLQEITEEDAMKEGVNWQDTAGLARFTAKKLFMTLWDSINGKKYPWASNPWVWVIAFKKL